MSPSVAYSPKRLIRSRMYGESAATADGVIPQPSKLTPAELPERLVDVVLARLGPQPAQQQRREQPARADREGDLHQIDPVRLLGGDVQRERLFEAVWERDGAVFAAFAFGDADAAGVEINVA